MSEEPAGLLNLTAAACCACHDTTRGCSTSYLGSTITPAPPAPPPAAPPAVAAQPPGAAADCHPTLPSSPPGCPLQKGAHTRLARFSSCEHTRQKVVVTRAFSHCRHCPSNELLTLAGWWRWCGAAMRLRARLAIYNLLLLYGHILLSPVRVPRLPLEGAEATYRHSLQ